MVFGEALPVTATIKFWDVLRDNCRKRHYRFEKKSETADVIAEYTDCVYFLPAPKPRHCTLFSSSFVYLFLPSTGKTHWYCFLCSRPGSFTVVNETLTTALSMFHQKHDFLHFFTMKSTFLRQVVIPCSSS